MSHGAGPAACLTRKNFMLNLNSLPMTKPLAFEVQNALLQKPQWPRECITNDDAKSIMSILRLATDDEIRSLFTESCVAGDNLMFLLLHMPLRTGS
jgi:hypothetical protein